MRESSAVRSDCAAEGAAKYEGVVVRDVRRALKDASREMRGLSTCSAMLGGSSMLREPMISLGDGGRRWKMEGGAHVFIEQRCVELRTPDF